MHSLQAHGAVILQWITPQGFAPGVHNIANTAQGHTKAPRRYGRVLPGTQGQCRHPGHRVLYTQPIEHIHHGIQTQVHTQTGGCQVIGIGQGAMQQYLAVGLPVEIARLPQLAPLAFDL